MAYTTRCTCTEQQLYFVGCDCDHTGPEKIVKTAAELDAEQEQAYLRYLADEEAAEQRYWDAIAEAEQRRDVYVDPREDFAEYTLAAAKHR